MKVSLNTVKQYTSVDLPVDELITKINAQLGGVEDVIDLEARYKDARIVRVVGCEKHPNADKLSVCKIDDGGAADVPRDEDGLVQVVCGAPNVHADMFVVWLPPASVVPATADDAEPFILGARELRGVVSQGMLASPKELALGDGHEGILELINADLPPAFEGGLAAGQSFADTFGLNDTIIDIENKMFTHRPDCFGQLGVAREIAGIQHQAFTSPSWYANQPSLPAGSGLELTVRNEAPDLVPRFMTLVMKDVTVKPSPVWLQAALVCLGAKPINNVVDVTNYVMLLTGQPTHAYDYDKLRGSTLVARMAVPGEKVTLLNHKTYELDSSDIVIADGEGPVGLAGIMGGGGSEVSDTTTRIVLECANFDMYAVRKSSMRHGVFTDALTRFNKGQSPLQNPYVLNLLFLSITDTAGGTAASKVFDQPESTAHQVPVEVTPEFINQRLGLSLKEDEIRTLLTNVEFTVESGLKVTSPYWRTDIELPEDVVEEVGRLYGFDKLPRELPLRSITPAPLNEALRLQRLIRQSLADSGVNEVLTYSFVHEKLLQRAEQDVSRAYKLSNALSPDLQYYRYSPLVSLLDKVHPNIKAGHDEFALFEIGKGHDKKMHADDGDDGLPGEPVTIEIVYASKASREGAAFFRVKRLVEQLASDLGVTLDYHATETADAPYEAARAATILDDQGKNIGLIGELRAAVRKNFKLPHYTASATLEFSGLLAAWQRVGAKYQPLSRFPSVSQDISLKVVPKTSYADVFKIANDIAASQQGLSIDITPRSIYQPADEQTRTITLRLKVTSHERTLTDGEVGQIVNEISARAATELKAETA